MRPWSRSRQHTSSWRYRGTGVLHKCSFYVVSDVYTFRTCLSSATSLDTLAVKGTEALHPTEPTISWCKPRLRPTQKLLAGVLTSETCHSRATKLDVDTCILADGPTGLFSSLGGGQVCSHTEGNLVTSARVQTAVLHQPKEHASQVWVEKEGSAQETWLISTNCHRGNNPWGMADKFGLTNRYKQLGLDLSGLACCLLLSGASSCCDPKRNSAQSSIGAAIKGSIGSNRGQHWQHQRAASKGSIRGQHQRVSLEGSIGSTRRKRARLIGAGLKVPHMPKQQCTA